MVRRIEALADAISRYTGWVDPESPAYQNRNPGLLKAISPKHPRDEQELRIFQSALDGYQALLFDLRVKCGGESRTRLKPTSTLTDLMLAYGYKSTMADVVVKYLRRSLQSEAINPDTPLAFFLE